MITDYKEYIKKNKILFVTNSTCNPNRLYLASLKTYIDYLPIHNYWCINGNKQTNGTLMYGFSAFRDMLHCCCTLWNFDYIVYIDEDCFIVDFDVLMREVELFINGQYCMAGINDGGVICHRTKSCYLVNTFVSFWNIKALRPRYKQYLRCVDDILRQKDSPYNYWYSKLPEDLKKKIHENAYEVLTDAKKYRDSLGAEPPYAMIVRNDPDNTVEPHQIPWSYFDTEGTNFEPYYLIEEGLTLTTGLPIYYIKCNDKFDPYITNDDSVENSGLTSEVRGKKSNVVFAYHTWFARAYNANPKNALMYKHTKRINTLINEAYAIIDKKNTSD